MKKLFFLALFSFLCQFIIAQACNSCTLNINGNDTATYIINSGQTLCIDSTGNLSGKITLNGGTICNKGFFSPKQLVLNAGTIYNYGNLTSVSALTFPNTLTMIIAESSVININGNLTNNGSIINYGYVNVYGNVQNNGTFNNNNVINCIQINAITNSGIINSN